MDYKKYLLEKLSNADFIRKVIIFGSRVKGRVNNNSDLDVLVVTNNDNSSFPKRYARISALFEPRLFPMDIVVKTYPEYKRRLRIKDPFIKEIENSGITIYER